VNRRLILIRIVYRSLFVAGIAALMWVGGQLGYAKTYQLYLMSKLNAQPELDNRISDATSPLSSSSSPLRNGDIVGRLDISARKISVVVLEGIEDDALGIAAGHVPGTSLPGSNGNVVIAAHRDTFFRELRNIDMGDRIELSTPAGTFEYFVSNTEIVKPSETRVLQSSGHSELTLITCYPFSFFGTAPERFVVHARPHSYQSGND
jgi:sortase A